MLFTTLPQFAVLGLLAFGALVLGLGLHPGSKKWRARLDDESDEFAAYRREADIQLRDANRRIGVLERDHAALQERTALAEQKAATAQDTIVAPVVTAAPLAGPLPVAPPHPKPPEPPEPVAPREPLVDRPMPIAANAAVPAFPTPMTHRTAPPTPPAVEAIPEPRLA